MIASCTKDTLFLNQFTVFFHKIFGGGACFQGRFSVPVGDGVRWGNSEESDGGFLEKLSADVKNAPYSKLEQILVF